MIHRMAHITGGGIEGDLCRIIPGGLSAKQVYYYKVAFKIQQINQEFVEVNNIVYQKIHVIGLKIFVRAVLSSGSYGKC